MSWVHRCDLCGWHRPATAETVMHPACAECGGVLRAVDAAEIARLDREDAEAEGPAHTHHASRKDVSSVLALLAVGPWLLPLVGVRITDLAFVAPAGMGLFAAASCREAARREPQWRAVWRLLGLTALLAVVSSVLAVVSAVASGSVASTAFEVGLVASLALLGGFAVLARRAGASARPERVVDVVLTVMVLSAAGLWFVIIPGFARGGVAETSVVVIDLAALLLVAVAVAAVVRAESSAPSADRWLLGCALATVAGDAVVSMDAAGQIAVSTSITAVSWTFAGYALAVAGDHGLHRPATVAGPLQQGRWIAWRLALPLAAVVAYPVAAALLYAGGALPEWGAAFFAAFFAVALVLAFGRQAWLLVDHHSSLLRERALRTEATRRNDELEALTGLATTMIQTLEEVPIVEGALTVLRSAARASSAALHDPQRRLVAAAGDWTSERTWAPPQRIYGVCAKGGRSILRLPLRARGEHLGLVTLVRPQDDPFTERESELHTLLVDELGMAIQNARDYRDKLEQAIRDPLTGAYNRRFFLEALSKEVGRSERYGSDATVVIFDVDDFKAVNDTLGHMTGDLVLRRIVELAEAIIRPMDTFARVGGEEFALLLPETAQLDALLVAERIRTTISRSAVLEDRRVTVSGGLASCPGDSTDAAGLQRLADAALYWAKRNGKDLCAVASEITADPSDGTAERGLSHLYGLVAMIDAQHLHTRDHSENVAAYAVALGQALGLDRDHIVRLRRAALLHDVGKIAVRTVVLDKPGRLTEEEYAEISTHSLVGGMMLAHAGLADEATWVRGHHERADGRGYPDGLTGDAIPLEARIIFVADSFEAMTSDRPYRAGMPVDDALAELRRHAGAQFDAHVAETFAALVESGAVAVLALRDEQLRRAA